MEAILRVAVLAVGVVAAVGLVLLAGTSRFQAVRERPCQEWDYLYHYTSAEGAAEIMRERKIRRSRRRSAGGVDAAFGPGVYLTTIRPRVGKRTILLNNYDGLTVADGRMDSADYFFRFRKEDLPGRKQRRNCQDIWLFPLSIDLTEIDYAFGETGAGQAVIYHHDMDDATLITGDQI